MRLVNLKHLVGAFGYSVAGIKRAWRQEQAFRHEVCLLPVICILLLFLRPGYLWAGILVGFWLIVMGFELLNSAIEEAFDLISPDYNIHVKYGKDMASAAIFMVLCCNGVLWAAMLASVFLP